MKTVKFSRITNFTGRNGFMRCAGVELLPTNYEEGNMLIVSPMTSQWKVGRCDIFIPVENVKSVALEMMAQVGQSMEVYLETYHEITAMIESVRNESGKYDHPMFAGIKKTQESFGSAGFYPLAKQLTDEFEEKFKGVSWGQDGGYGEWIDELAGFFYDHRLVRGE